jgi:hypothetical protein
LLQGWAGGVAPRLNNKAWTWQVAAMWQRSQRVRIHNPASASRQFFGNFL